MLVWKKELDFIKQKIEMFKISPRKKAEHTQMTAKNVFQEKIDYKGNGFFASTQSRETL